MKKLFFIQLFIVISVTCMSAQLKVSSAGNVGIKLPSATSVPLSPLSIGGEGYSSDLVSLDGSGKSTVLNIINPTSSSNYRAYGINSSISGGTSYGALAIRGLADSNGSGTSGYGFGIVGEALDYYRNFGVAGALASSVAQGAGVFGSVSSSGYSIVNGRYAGYFYGDVEATGTITGVNLSKSDEIYTQNIAELDSKPVFKNLLSLHPITYNLKQRYVEHLGDGEIKQVPLYDESSEVFQKTHYGLEAKELQELYPDLVYKNGEGHLAINYTELVPILIESVKILNEKIERLENNTPSLRSAEQTSGVSNIGNTTQQAILYQNAPNPFTESTEVRFSLPAQTKQAYICIFNLQGTMLKKTRNLVGESKVLIHGSELKAGMYLYSLLVDGQEVDTKRMILTK